MSVGKCPDIYECRLGSDSVLKQMQMVNMKAQAELRKLRARVAQLEGLITECLYTGSMTVPELNRLELKLQAALDGEKGKGV